MKSPRLVLVALLVTTVLAACGKDHVAPGSSGDPTTTTTDAAAETTTTTAADADEGESTVVDVVGTDFAYAVEGGTTIPAGTVTVNLTNDGAEEHQVTIVQFKDGKGLADLDAAGADPSQLDDVLAAFGGPNGAAPGDTVTATQSLEPGDYLFACFIPSPTDGVPHAAKGMIAPVTVEGDGGSAAPEADGRLVLADYDFGFGDDALIEAGSYAITNEGTQYHEAVLYAPAAGSTADDVIAFFTAATPPPGPPPFVPAGGVAAFDPGGTVVTDIAAGEYVFICFLPDATDGAPHFTKGMIQIVNVE